MPPSSGALPISAWSSASERRCRSTPAASAYSPATSSRRRAISTVPIFGVGLLYQEGYFRQIIDVSGWQQEAYPYNEPAMLPIQPARDQDGGWLRIPLNLPGRTLLLRVWKAAVGRTVLYLLDSNDPLNSPADRGITAKLYGGGSEMRLMQEIVLGVAGWRVIEALHPETEVCHLNEGHAAFAVLERARLLARRSAVCASGRPSGRRAAATCSRPIRPSRRPSIASTPP